MTEFQIEDLGGFTRKLFLEDAFDRFWLKEAEIVTFNRFAIDGRIHPDFYTIQEREQMELGEYSVWGRLRPVCFSLIRGKRLPESFRVILMADPGEKARFLTERSLQMNGEQIQGLYLQIRYESGRLGCITGTSLGVFTMDRSVEREWDSYVEELLKRMKIASTRF